MLLLRRRALAASDGRSVAPLWQISWLWLCPRTGAWQSDDSHPGRTPGSCFRCRAGRCGPPQASFTAPRDAVTRDSAPASTSPAPRASPLAHTRPTHRSHTTPHTRPFNRQPSGPASFPQSGTPAPRRQGLAAGGAVAHGALPTTGRLIRLRWCSTNLSLLMAPLDRLPKAGRCLVAFNGRPSPMGVPVGHARP